MSFRPPPASRLPPTLGFLFLVGMVPLALAEPSLQDIAPSQARLVLAQSAPAGAGAAVSSEAVATMPEIPGRLQVPKVESEPVPAPAPEAAPPAPPAPIDPLLDPTRPRNCQLTVEKEQRVRCGKIEVVLPAGVYKQSLVVENPEGRRATDPTDLKRQQPGLGYIRYLSDARLQVEGQPRIGGLDVPILAGDNLPVRIWYKKMAEPDGWTKALAFVLPPAGLIAGAGAWSSGNTLLPDSPPLFQEARDYFLKPPKPAPDPNVTPQPSHVRPLVAPGTPGTSRMRSK